MQLIYFLIMPQTADELLSTESEIYAYVAGWLPLIVNCSGRYLASTAYTCILQMVSTQISQPYIHRLIAAERIHWQVVVRK